MTELNRMQSTITAPPTLWRRISDHIEMPWALISGAAFFLVWEVVVDTLKVPTYLLPAPSAVVQDMVTNWHLLFHHSLVTLYEIGLGFLVSIAIAMPLAVLFTYSRVFEKMIYPLIVGTQTIPKVAVAPLFLVWFGFGMTPKIIIVTLMTFFPIVINAVVGLKSLNFQTVYLAQSMGAGPLQVFWHFRLPNALPSIFAGLKVASSPNSSALTVGLAISLLSQLPIRTSRDSSRLSPSCRWSASCSSGLLAILSAVSCHGMPL
jgi:ABC-type nitrate/sulfonate/bicarbonate transport system permease component